MEYQRESCFSCRECGKARDEGPYPRWAIDTRSVARCIQGGKDSSVPGASPDAQLGYLLCSRRRSQHMWGARLDNNARLTIAWSSEGAADGATCRTRSMREQRLAVAVSFRSRCDLALSEYRCAEHRLKTNLQRASASKSSRRQLHRLPAVVPELSKVCRVPALAPFPTCQ